ncbi:MAG: hypothetical protein U0176_05795 [Bacteroidia bacterium]
MHRILLLCFLLAMGVVSHAQSNARLGFQVGMGSSWDYGIEMPNVPGYAPYSSARTSAWSFDAFVGIPFGRLTVYPTFIYSVPYRSILIENLNGDYIPEGYSISLPYSTNNPDEIDGPTYYDLSSRAMIWEQKLGAMALFHVGGGLEFGTGIFRRQKTITITSPVLYDAYWYESSTGTQTDNYSYYDTYTDHFEFDEITFNSISVPLVMQWRYESSYLYTGTSIVRWVGGGDAYWSFRFTTGFHF